VDITYSPDSVSHFRIGGFATGRYNCKCTDCGKEFIGDKHALQCLACVIKIAEANATELAAARATISKDDKFRKFIFKRLVSCLHSTLRSYNGNKNR
jgi:hypothetical protein